MMLHPVLGVAGERRLLLGNEAVARGAIEGGVEVAASYPGTPASEILETLAEVAEEVGIYVEWSTNEMVAWEVAVGAAMCNKRSMASMKHIGVNWVIDPLMHSVLHGFNAGLLLVSCDDPSGHSSATEQDNRNLAYMAEIPILEPSDPQEAKDFTVEAIEISEELRVPVLLRLVTRVAHTRGDVVLGELRRESRKPEFHDDFYTKFVLKKGFAGPRVIPELHRILHEKLERAVKLAEKRKLNKVKGGGGELLIVSSGVAYSYVKEAIEDLGIEDKVTVLKVEMVHPFPAELLRELLRDHRRVLVLEEGEPYLEREVKLAAFDGKCTVEVHGKLSGKIGRVGELDPVEVRKAIAEMLGVEVEGEGPSIGELELRELTTPRVISFCPGCPHRAAFYALKKAINKVCKGKHLAIGDIGCYTMGMNPPLRVQQTVFCMGGSIGMACGAAHSGLDCPVIATAGDSTFFHACIPGLINAVYNKAKLLFHILDNEATAMTGFQPHPGTGKTAVGLEARKIKIEDVARACGAGFVEVVDPYDLKRCEEVFAKALRYEGVAVVITRRECAQLFLRKLRHKGLKPSLVVVDEELCKGCKVCINQFGCPAICWDQEKDKARVDPVLCIGCGVCIQVCPFNALKWGERR